MRLKGRVIAIHTEHCFVIADGKIACKHIDEELEHELWLFVCELKKRNNIDFYFNHVVFEMRTAYGDLYYIGVNDNRISVGTKMHSLDDSDRIKLENPMYFVNV